LFGQFFPRRLDDPTQGHKLALWLFGLVVLMKSAQSIAIMVGGYEVAKSVDGIPLDTYPPLAAQAVVAALTQLSLWRLSFCVVGWVVLLRYRSAVPLMFALFALNYLAGETLFHFIPLPRVGSPPGPTVNMVLFGLMLAGLVLSIQGRKHQANAA
jgi:hypothetical protein